VRGRLEEVCFELLDAERGSFEFQPGRPSAMPQTTRLDVETVLEGAGTRLREWQALQEALPSLDVQPRLAEDLVAAQVVIDQERWRVLTVIDGRRNLRAIGRTLALSDFDVCRLVKSLIDEGVVELDPRSTALAPASRDAVPTIPPPGADPAVRLAAAGPSAGASAGASVAGSGGPSGTGGAAEAPSGATITIDVDDDGSNLITLPGGDPADVPPRRDPPGAGPTGVEPSGAGPSGADPSGVDPSGADPSGVEPPDDGAPNGGRRRRVVRIRSRSKPAAG
jgi:hypothetical protein